jgi:hypothetical protein
VIVDSVLNRFPSFGKTLRRPIGCAEGIAPLTERDAPPGDGAGGIGLEDVAKTVDGDGEPEGVKQRDGSVETCRDRGRARGFKVNFAEMFVSVGRHGLVGGVVVILRGEDRGKKQE